MRKPHTTDSTHGLPTFPNIVKDFIPTGPDQLWVSDITYIVIWLPDGCYRFGYLSLVLDTYSKEIVGWSVGDTLQTEYPIEALKMALKRLEGKEHSLIHHSDRGCQYASHEYVKLLRDNNIRISMMTPAKAAKCSGEIEKKWYSYRENSIKKKLGNL